MICSIPLMEISMKAIVLLLSAFAMVESYSSYRRSSSLESFLPGSELAKLAQPISNLLISKPREECSMSTPQLIKHYGYPVETHKIRTADGYILTTFRIPHGKNGTTVEKKEPVFIQHGLVCSSNDWFLLSPDKTLPFLLADLGYDVWMGNCRGNNYSLAHESLSTDDPKFWDFSFDEMGLYDIPAALNYVLSNTDRPQGQVSYVGHSMGTLMFFIAMDKHPELQGKVRKMIALAPAVYVSHVKSLVRLLAQVPSEVLNVLFNLLGKGRVLPEEVNDYMKIFGPVICSGELTSSYVCENIFFLITGFDPSQYNRETVCMVAGHTPSDVSGRTLIHYLQYIRPSVVREASGLTCSQELTLNDSPSFQAYDYGCSGNMLKYNSYQPPKYNLSNNNVETMVMWGNNDWLVAPADAERAVKELGNVNKKYSRMAKDLKYNHLDFTYADNIKDQIFDDCIQFLSE